MVGCVAREPKPTVLVVPGGDAPPHAAGPFEGWGTSLAWFGERGLSGTACIAAAPPAAAAGRAPAPGCCHQTPAPLQ